MVKPLGKVIKWLVVLLGVIVLVMVIWWQVDRQKYQNLVSTSDEVKKWEADPRPLQSKAKTMNQFKKMNSKNSEQATPRLIKSVVIPGLRGAWSIDNKSGEPKFGNDWVPQGVTQSEDHYYISMYDGDHQLNSLIFQIDKQTGKYIKTLILNSKAHIGAVYYDLNHDRIIYSNDNKKGARFGYISKAEIDRYQAKKMKKPIHSKTIPWGVGARTSALAIYKNQLIVAKYGKKKIERSIFTIPLNQEGLPEPMTLTAVKQLVAESNITSTNKALKLLIDRQIISSYHPGWNRLQGVAISKADLAILSQSNGQRPGKLLFNNFSDKNKNWNKLSFEKPIGGAVIVNVPHSVEEVSLDKKEKNLAVIFESGAKKYREQGAFYKRPTFIDRLEIIPIDIIEEK